MKAGSASAGGDGTEGRESWDFGRLLGWHLLRGTRPGGRVDQPGRKWTFKAFADATGLGDRTVRFWLRSEHLPPEIDTIERVLFGNDACYAGWRLELRRAHAAGWNAKRDSRSTQSANARAVTALYGVPPRIPGFVGRSEELDQLDAILNEGRPAAVTQVVGRAAVQGLGGVGKTSLAIEYAHRSHDKYAGVWWCPAETRSGLIGSLAALATTLKVTTENEADLEKAAQSVLRHLTEQGGVWLLVYDNVAEPKELTDLLPASGARVLITSRFPDWAGLVDEIPIDVLPIDKAEKFLRFRAGRKRDMTASALAEALGRLPLALDHAAAYCKLTGMSFDRYAERVRELMVKEPKGAVYARSVAATIWLAIEKASQECPAAVRLLSFFSVLAPDRIPLDLVDDSILGQNTKDEAVLALVSVSLIKHDPFPDGTPAVTVHRLVQAEMRSRLAI
jgi:NB-ARC domain-containing protein